MAKRPSPASLLKAWSLKVRARDGNACQVCARTEYIQAHHLLPKERYPEHKLEVINGIALCAKCHKFGKFSAHRNPWWFVEWFKKNRPTVYIWIMNHLDPF